APVAALPGDRQAARRGRADGPAGRGRHDGAGGARRREVPPVGDARRRRPRAPLPSRLGRCDLILRRPAGALRVLLLRRSGADGRRDGRGLRPRAVHGARPRAPDTRGGDMTETYDVVVVGAGSGGAVVARRLVDAGARVCLLEAGGPDENPAIHEPARVFELWESPDDWAYLTVPQAACAGRQLFWPRGKVLGGSSCLNGMIYIRGHRSDYDAWAYAGNAGWGYDEVLPLFKRSEDFDAGESQFHATGGPLHVRSQYRPHPVIAAAVEASQQAGVPFNPDHNGAELDGVGYAQLMI